MRNYLKEVNRVLESEPDPAFARWAKIIFENLNLAGNEKYLSVAKKFIDKKRFRIFGQFNF